MTDLRDRGRVIKGPIAGYSKKMVNFIKRWPATVRNLFILIRKRWPAKASSKKMINFNKRWPLLLIILKGPGGQSRLGQTTGTEMLYFWTPSNHSKGSGRIPSISRVILIILIYVGGGGWWGGNLKIAKPAFS